MVVDLVMWVTENGVLTDQIGITTPYAAQVSLYMQILKKVQHDTPDEVVEVTCKNCQQSLGSDTLVRLISNSKRCVRNSWLR